MSTPDVTEALLTTAHSYRNRGWRVIELHSVDETGACSCKRAAHCTSAGKHPRDNAWQNTPPYSAPDIQALWEARPHANVGLATGEASGFWVLDIDGEAGAATMAAAVERGGQLPATRVVGTGSGGYHYYFAMEPGLRNSQGRIGPGVDVRADGGQVVAPPSVSAKGEYTLLRDAAVLGAPEWLLELARKPEHAEPEVTAEVLPKPEDIPAEEWDRLRVYTEKAVKANTARLHDLKTKGWNGEAWDATTFEVACALLELANSPWNGLPVAAARALLVQHAPRDLNFTTEVVEAKWNSAVQKVGAKARAYPEGRPKDDGGLAMFGGPDVRRTDPTEGGGPTTDPAVGRWSLTRFFTGEKGTELDAVELTKGVFELGPIGWGRDMDFWSYKDGVWRSDRTVVKERVTRLLDYKYRSGIYPTIKDTSQFRAVRLEGDPTTGWINFRNGMLDWQTGELAPHDPDFKSTIQLGVEYNPAAVCPTFDAFLADVMHEDYVRLAWEMLGYLMFSGNPLQIAFLFYGAGQNGKGTLIRVIEQMLGRENIAHESLNQLNTSTFSAVNLFGKIANIAGDIDATYQENTANFKKITGEDMLGAERKYGDRFEFENWAVPLFSANEFPGSSDVTEGYLRRWIVLHFHKKILNPTRALSDLLALEIEGIAAKAIPSLQGLMQRGKFDLSGEAGKGVEKFAETIDQVRQWLRHGGPLEAPGTEQALSEIYFEYTVWAGRTGGKAMREQVFSRRLAAAGFEAVEHAGITYHRNIRVAAADRNSNVTPSNFF